MTRYYTRSGIYKHGLVADRVKELYFLYWDHKKKVHTFVAVDFITKYHKGWVPGYFGTPVVFESPEHEREFLDFHPDAKDMRWWHRYGNAYGCTPVGLDEKDIPVEFRHGRWCWKKA